MPTSKVEGANAQDIFNNIVAVLIVGLIGPVSFPLIVIREEKGPIYKKIGIGFLSFLAGCIMMPISWVALALVVGLAVAVVGIYVALMAGYVALYPFGFHKWNSKYPKIFTGVIFGLATVAGLALLYQSMVVAGVLASTFIFPPAVVIALTVAACYFTAGVFLRLAVQDVVQKKLNIESDKKVYIFGFSAIALLTGGVLANFVVAAVFPPLVIGILVGIATLAVTGAIYGTVEYFREREVGKVHGATASKRTGFREVQTTENLEEYNAQQRARAATAYAGRAHPVHATPAVQVLQNPTVGQTYTASQLKQGNIVEYNGQFYILRVSESRARYAFYEMEPTANGFWQAGNREFEISAQKEVKFLSRDIMSFKSAPRPVVYGR